MSNMIPTAQTASLVFFNICLLIIMFALMKKALRPPYSVTSINRKITIFLMFIFVLFSFWGADWFGYLSSYLKIIENENTNLEKIYYWIIQELFPNYIVFRIIIWGSSLVIFIHTIKRLSISYNLAIFIFSTTYLIWFSYARVTFAMTLAYYGLSLLYKPYKSRILSFIIGVFFIYIAFHFHKSAIFAIAISLLVILSSKYESKFLLVSLIIYPIIVIITQYYLGNFMMLEFYEEDGVLDANFASGQRYLDADETKHGLGYILQSIFERTPYYILAYISFKYIRSRHYLQCPKDIKPFIRMLYFIVYIATIFSFDLGTNTHVVYVRFLRFAAIPAVVVMTYFLNIQFYPKIMRCTYWLAFMGTLYVVAYAMYNAYDANGLF